jgi:RNA polymerase sigma-70 factor (ECF subfamily)
MSSRLPDRSQQRVLRDLGDDAVRATVTAYVEAWERCDVDAVVALLAADVTITMPPFVEWFAGREAVAAFLAAVPLLGGRRWSCRAGAVNGQPAMEAHVWDEQVGAFLAHGVSVLSFDERGDITGIDAFLEPELVGRRYSSVATWSGT